MARVDRRQFFRIGGLASGIGAGLPRVAFGDAVDDRADRTVRLSGDGVGLTPTQYAGLLNQLVEATGFAPDSYSLGGIVDEIEDECARVLGKERAIFMPTGTLANHMAVRALAGGSSRVVVQEESHFYQDEGDCAQTLSALTLVPIAPGRATFTRDEVQRVIDQLTRPFRRHPRRSRESRGGACERRHAGDEAGLDRPGQSPRQAWPGGSPRQGDRRALYPRGEATFVFGGTMVGGKT